MTDAIILDPDDIIDLLCYNYSIEKEHVKRDGENYIIELPGKREIWEGEENGIPHK